MKKESFFLPSLCGLSEWRSFFWGGDRKRGDPTIVFEEIMFSLESTFS